MGLSGSYATARAGVLSLEDIATGLSRIPRFGGQTVLHWSVAEHLLAGVEYLRDAWSPSQLLDFALHDAHEAATSDIPTHFKTPDMKRLQKQLDVRLYKFLGLPLPDRLRRGLVEMADREMLVSEAKVVCPQATYDKIVEEVRQYANWHACRAVRRVLSSYSDEDGVAEAWLKTVEELIRATN